MEKEGCRCPKRKVRLFFFLHCWPGCRPAGWSGSGGLGAKEQGIQDPIKGADVRDKWDQYKGVGVSLDDPYENYRRNKSYNFVARMKAREEGNVNSEHTHTHTRRSSVLIFGSIHYYFYIG